MASFELPKGKPTWVLVRSDKRKGGRDMDVVFAAIEKRFIGKFYFKKYNWEGESARNAVEKFSLAGVPASVLADANGQVVEKFEGIRSVREMSDRLVNLLRSSGVSSSARGR